MQLDHRRLAMIFLFLLSLALGDRLTSCGHPGQPAWSARVQPFADSKPETARLRWQDGPLRILAATFQEATHGS